MIADSIEMAIDTARVSRRSCNLAALLPYPESKGEVLLDPILIAVHDDLESFAGREGLSPHTNL
jgi:hypothetical protein